MLIDATQRTTTTSRMKMMLMLFLLAVLFLSVEYCKGFSTMTTTRQTLFPSSSLTRYDNTQQTLDNNNKRCGSGSVRVLSPSVPSFSTTSSTALSGLSLLPLDMTKDSSDSSDDGPKMNSTSMIKAAAILSFENIKNTQLMKSGTEFLSNVVYGSSKVHQNFVNIWWELIVKRTVLFTLPFFIVLIAFLFSNNPTLSNVSLFTSQFLIQTLTPIAIFATKFMTIITLPFHVAVASVTNPNRTWEIIVKLPKLILDTLSSKSIGGGDQLADMSQRSLFIFAVGIAPIIEEIVFRSGFIKAWEFIAALPSKLLTPNKQYTDDDSSSNNTGIDDGTNNNDDDKSRAVSKMRNNMILVNSIVFGLIHLGNHLPLNTEMISNNAKVAMDTIGKDAIEYFPFLFENGGFRLIITNGALVLAICQTIITTNIARKIFCPIFLERGLGASIGAHMMYNLNAILVWYTVPLRLVVKLIRRPVINLVRRLFPPKNNDTKERRHDDTAASNTDPV